MALVFLILYVTFCILVAYAGRHTNVGFVGVFFLSVLLTPIVTAIMMFFFLPERQRKPKKTDKPTAGV